jgi:hypothetical protein
MIHLETDFTINLRDYIEHLYGNFPHKKAKTSQKDPRKARNRPKSFLKPETGSPT